jgi:hypothetical protein
LARRPDRRRTEDTPPPDQRSGRWGHVDELDQALAAEEGGDD